MGNRVVQKCPVRRFGAEIEVNSFDGMNRPADHERGAMPEGMAAIAEMVQAVCRDKVMLQKWGNNHNIQSWVLKPDSSCGIEICTPVLKGMRGIKSMCEVVRALNMDGRVVADGRCSFHVHVDVHDMTPMEVANVLTWWIKMEYALMRMVPTHRNRNRYCQMLSLSDMFRDLSDPMYGPGDLISLAGQHKYLSANTYHMSSSKRHTIEFRIMDSSACMNWQDAKNYVVFLLHFVERMSRMRVPEYTGDPMTGYAWLDVGDAMAALGLRDGKGLSEGMSEMRRWLAGRMSHNKPDFSGGTFGSSLRCVGGDIISEIGGAEPLLPCLVFCEDKFSP